ncbi:hypothetical protein FB45DRAFT_34771 [Roridomyces roridus]|uniref:Protein kinase domain-containing protein n=1 Tax=Roridomyces roridus TaxID=1738132 RepID=A0AAD7G3D4_9AGAR|nr:hypothetical protein FB45DRAFT_34771 [Roridomyces roridus]
MQNEAHSTPDCEEEPKTDKTDSAGFAGAFFPQSHNLRVMGGTFTSEVHIQQAVQIPREHFQWIGRGEIDLRREIRPDGEPYMVERYRYGNRVCRRYTANIRERSEKTVILYDGENAEEECRQYISRHTNLWHPNIMQIFGVSNLGGKHAVIAQDSLIPYNEYLARHRDSVILRVFLLALWVRIKHSTCFESAYLIQFQDFRSRGHHELPPRPAVPGELPIKGYLHGAHPSVTRTGGSATPPVDCVQTLSPTASGCQ